MPESVWRHENLDVLRGWLEARSPLDGPETLFQDALIEGRLAMVPLLAQHVLCRHPERVVIWASKCEHPVPEAWVARWFSELNRSQQDHAIDVSLEGAIQHQRLELFDALVGQAKKQQMDVVWHPLFSQVSQSPSTGWAAGAACLMRHRVVQPDEVLAELVEAHQRERANWVMSVLPPEEQGALLHTWSAQCPGFFDEALAIHQRWSQAQSRQSQSLSSLPERSRTRRRS